jgi:chromosome segregation ATPase
MSASEYGTEAHVVSTTSRTMVLDGEFDGNDQLTYRPDRKVILVESGAIEELETELAEVDENARESGAIAERARQRLADVEQERDALREKLDDAEATVARVKRFAADMRGWCSPHGVAYDYANRLDAVIDGGA